MNPARARLWRHALALAALGGWAAASHLATAGVGPAGLRVLVALAPLALAVLLAAWPSRWRLPAALALVLALALALGRWGDALGARVSWLFYLEHLGVHLALAAWFGRSLAAGREPVVTAMARTLAPAPLSARARRYTRAVTWAWTLFLLANAALSTLLFAAAPVAVWSVHANLLTGPLVAAFFGLEVLVRSRVLPRGERPTLADVVRAYRTQRHGATLPHV